MLFLGLDIGTQSVKAVITDDRFRPVGAGSTPLRYDVQPGGAVEQNAGDWLAGLKPAIAAAIKSAGCQAEDIAALGTGGQLDGCVPVDANGDPLHPCLIWMDRRADELIQDVPAELILERCGVVRDASHMAAKIAWFERERPDIAQRTALYHQPVSFVVARLTGRAVIDRALASTTMLYDLHAQNYALDLCGTFHINPAKLPKLGSMAAPAGKLSVGGSSITGLPPGLPVAVGTGDDFTNAIGAGLLEPGALLCQIGTAEVVGAMHPTLAIDRHGLVETHAFAPDLYFIENPGWLSGGAIEWLIRLLRLKDVEELNSLAARCQPGADGVNFFPALTGAMTPEWHANMRACFYGLGAEHGAAQLARAVMEGTAFAMYDVALRLRELGVAFESIKLAGGGAASHLWAQIRAGVSGLPVEVLDVADASPIGAAVLAAIASGALGSIEDARPYLARPAKVIEPQNDAEAAYQLAYQRHRALFEHLKALQHKQAGHKS